MMNFLPWYCANRYQTFHFTLDVRLKRCPRCGDTRFYKGKEKERKGVPCSPLVKSTATVS